MGDLSLIRNSRKLKSATAEVYFCTSEHLVKVAASGDFFGEVVVANAA